MAETNKTRKQRRLQKSIFAKKWGRRIIWLIVVALIATSVAIVGHIAYFYYRSDHVGHQLSIKEQKLITQVQQSSGSKVISCAPPGQNDSSPTPAGLLTIPAIGLQKAPVVQGTDGPQLNVAIGHVNTSVWPGQPGTSVLSAHDVTWFSHTPSLNPGDLIQYETPCNIYTFKVTSHKIVSSQSSVVNTSSPSLVLDTCWPINALYLTSTRYLTFSTFVSQVPTYAPITTKLNAANSLNLPAGPQLSAAAKFTFPYLPFPLGVLSFAGSPSPSWEQSNSPINAEVPVIEEFYDGIYAAQHNNPAWFSQVAPSVPFKDTTVIQNSRSLVYEGDVNPTLVVKSTNLVGFTIAGYLLVSGGIAPGKYSYTVSGTVTANTPYIPSFTMSTGN
jgi:sortase A